MEERRGMWKERSEGYVTEVSRYDDWARSQTSIFKSFYFENRDTIIIENSNNNLAKVKQETEYYRASTTS